MKKLLSAILFVCLACVPLSALAEPLSPAPWDHHRAHRIFINANNGGEVNPAGVLTVRDGKSATISIRPHDGYAVKKVIVDGKDVGPVRRYRFTDVHDSHRVQVVFERVHRFGWQRDDRQDNNHHDRH